MVAHREDEIKHDATKVSTLPSFEVLDGVAAVGDPEQHRLTSTYYDTADLRLAAAGITLRRRTGGKDAGWHLKIPSDGARHEVRVGLGRSARNVPPRLRATVTALVRDDGLAPVATIETRRTTLNLLGPDGQVLAEVADDHVASTAHRPDARDREITWHEIEVELVDGDERLLDSAAHLLDEAGAPRSRSRSKLARALGDRLPGPRIPAPRGKSDPIAALVQARLAEQIDALLAADPAVREDLPDGVHAMRVAARRLRSALATYRPFLGRDAVEPIRAELKWLGDLLGHARDPEVQREQLLDLVGDVAADESDDVEGAAAATGRIADAFDELYAAAREDCLAALSSARYRTLLDRLDRLVARPAWLPEAEDPIKRAGVARVRHEWKRVRARMDALGDQDRDEELHEVRKAVRRLRYAVEPLHPVYGKDAKRLVKRLKRVQDVLGSHHDTVTARARLHRLAGVATDHGESATIYRVLHDRQTEQARGLESEADDVLADATETYGTWPG